MIKDQHFTCAKEEDFLCPKRRKQLLAHLALKGKFLSSEANIFKKKKDFG